MTALFALALAAGAFFRLEGLGRKVVWFDEAVTLTLVSGRTGAEVRRALAAGEPGAEQLRELQRVKPGSRVGDVVSEVGRTDPQLPPLYFVAARLWAQTFADSPAGVRAVSAVFGVLALPCFYWLCREMFGPGPSPAVATALLAVSPFHVAYAQEARPYSLWALLTIVSSAALLYALRAQTAQAWALYAVSAAAGLYAHALFAAVVGAHALYIAAAELRLSGARKFRPTKAALGFALSAALALAAFAPWALKIREAAATVEAKTAWAREEVGAGPMLKSWAHGLARVFLDLGGRSAAEASEPYGVVSPLTEAALWPLAALALFALYRVCRDAPRRAWLLVLLLAACVFVPLAGADLALGGKRSTVGRYLFPTYLAAQAAVAHLLASRALVVGGRRARAWGAALAVVVACGLASCAVMWREETWRNKGQLTGMRGVVRVVNASERPLVVTTFAGMNAGNALALAHSLDSRARFRFIADAREPVPPPPTEVFYLGLTESARRRLAEAGRRLEPAGPPELWRMVR
ncbi:MAG TPA: glycosyltransferase family 39 protein [Pyrinomonadaceae bacterium]|nr:glycosyltransferase family 39 protein [Pyrinomonadaceae bacterium]